MQRTRSQDLFDFVEIPNDPKDLKDPKDESDKPQSDPSPTESDIESGWEEIPSSTGPSGENSNNYPPPDMIPQKRRYFKFF